MVQHLSLLTLALIPALALVNPAQAKPVYKEVILKEKSFTVPPGKCGIKKFSLVTYASETGDSFGVKGTARNIALAAAFSTSDPTCADQYGFVQFIHGCVFGVTYQAGTNTVIKKFISERRDWFGQDIPFRHPKWVVDTNGLDPIYTSVDFDAHASRIDYSFATKNPIPFKNNRADLLAIREPLQSHATYFKDLRNEATQLRITDYPSGAFFSEPDPSVEKYSASNTSLEFKTCIYHLNDIPTQGSPATPDVSETKGGPIACLDWDHKNVFNPITRVFDHPAEVDGFCGE